MKLIMHITNKLKLVVAIVLSITSTSCNNWLDLDSEDRILENTLFSSPSGFMSALNGVYIEFLKPNMYGDVLTYKTFDVLAQYYDCSADEHPMQRLIKYEPTAKAGQVSGLWSTAYTLLVNVNTIIESCDARRNVLSNEYYHVLKGEALVMRALIHFELLRVFGPIYSVSPETECIPYANSSDLVVRPLKKASEIATLIMNDFKEAENLLKGYDPVITQGAPFKDAGAGIPNDMAYRSMRLNYYAVRAYIARLALYIGDRETALSYAKSVIKETQEDNQWFPLITRAAATTPMKQDRIYQSEILFGLYNLKRGTIFDNTFSNKMGNNVVLRPSSDNIEALYEDNTKLNDWRYTEQWMTLKDPDGNEQKYFVKYMPIDDTNTDGVSQGYTYIVPIMRISEMYLIVAECETDETEAFSYLNKLRAARGIAMVEPGPDRQKLVEAEFRREFIGEGQLFWFYKRLNLTEIPSCTNFNEMVAMQESYYLFSLPQGELDKRKEKK